MSKIKGANTKPEIALRKLLHSMGFRFRLHVKHLPGKPDIVLSKYKTAIFVHGCFWHAHPGCNRAKLPVSNQGFWESKIKRNKDRDEGNLLMLENLGWQVLVIWTCEMNKKELLEQKLKGLLIDGASETAKQS